MIYRSSLNPTITSFTPIGDRVLMRRHPLPEKIGDISMPTTARHVDLARFDVIACGPKCENVKPGDTAMAPRQLTFGRIDLDGEQLEIASESLLSVYIPKE